MLILIIDEKLENCLVHNDFSIEKNSNRIITTPTISDLAEKGIIIDTLRLAPTSIPSRDSFFRGKFNLDQVFFFFFFFLWRL